MQHVLVLPLNELHAVMVDVFGFTVQRDACGTPC